MSYTEITFLLGFFFLAFPMGSEGIKPSRREWLGGEKKWERGKTPNFPPGNDLSIGKLIKLVMLRGKFHFFPHFSQFFGAGSARDLREGGAGGVPAASASPRIHSGNVSSPKNPRFPGTGRVFQPPRLLGAAFISSALPGGV